MRVVLRGLYSMGALAALSLTPGPGDASHAAAIAVPVPHPWSQEGPAAQELPIEETYGRQCAACHGEEGRGDGRMARRFKPPPADFQDPDGVPKLTDEQLIRVIMDGRASMPAFGDVLNEEVAAALVAYVRELSRGSER